jgi:hypothetical protein
MARLEQNPANPNNHHAVKYDSWLGLLRTKGRDIHDW